MLTLATACLGNRTAIEYGNSRHFTTSLNRRQSKSARRSDDANPQEFRGRAVRLGMESDRPIAQIAADLGIHREALRTWVRQAGAGTRPEQLTLAEREELKQLCKENSELNRANEILKAASALFAAELGRPRTKQSR